MKPSRDFKGHPRELFVQEGRARLDRRAHRCAIELHEEAVTKSESIIQAHGGSDNILGPTVNRFETGAAQSRSKHARRQSGSEPSKVPLVPGTSGVRDEATQQKPERNASGRTWQSIKD